MKFEKGLKTLNFETFLNILHYKFKTMATDYKNTTQENLDNHIDNLLDVLDGIEIGKVTVLTGGNATGKSVIRKLLTSKIMETLGTGNRSVVSSVSMQLRTGTPDSLLGSGLDSMMRDVPWSSTSEHTVTLLDGMTKNFTEDLEDCKKRFLVIDELEIGMSKELQLGTCLWLNDVISKILKNTYGILIITHSDIVVSNIKHDKFINIEGMSEEEWLNREIKPVSPEDLRNWSSALHRAIAAREKKS